MQILVTTNHRRVLVEAPDVGYAMVSMTQDDMSEVAVSARPATVEEEEAAIDDLFDRSEWPPLTSKEEGRHAQ